MGREAGVDPTDFIAIGSRLVIALNFRRRPEAMVSDNCRPVQRPAAGVAITPEV